MSWKDDVKELTKDDARRADEMMPEPLFETYHMPGPAKLCLVCGTRRATSALWSASKGRSVVPMCENCARDWNIYGYSILRRVKPAKLFWRLVKYKARHPFGRPTPGDLAADIKELLRWSRKMRRLMGKKM